MTQGGQGLEFRGRGAREQRPGGEGLKGLGVRVKRQVAGEREARGQG